MYNPDTNSFTCAVSPNVSKLPNLMWHITDICPLGCEYCFATKTAQTFPAIRIAESVNLMVKLGVEKVDIAGGEPMVCRELPTFSDALLNSHIHQTITTSGVCSSANRDWLLKNHCRFSRIIVSIDRARKEEHDKQRAFDGAFQAAIDICNALRSSGCTRLRINTVVTRALLKSNELRCAMAELITSIAPLEWCLISPHPANEKPNFHSYRITEEDFASTTLAIRDVIPEVKVLIRTVDLYSGYWVLYPDSTLRQHSNTKQDFNEILFEEKSLNQILAMLAKSPSSLPIQE